MRREFEQPFDTQLYREHSYKKLLKFDDFSLSYNESVMSWMFLGHSVCDRTCAEKGF